MSENNDTTSSSNKVVIAIVAVVAILVVVFGLWFFLGNSDTDDASQDESTTSTSETSNTTDATDTTTDNDEETNDTSDATLATQYKNSLGNYTGTWNDPTYNLFDKKLTGSLVKASNDSLVLTLNLYGLTFGLADPQSVAANLGADGSVSLGDSTPLVSGLKGTFDPVTGAFDITASSPVLGEDAIAFIGTISTGGNFFGTAVVTPAGGGDLEMTLE